MYTCRWAVCKMPCNRRLALKSFALLLACILSNTRSFSSAEATQQHWSAWEWEEPSYPAASNSHHGADAQTARFGARRCRSMARHGSFGLAESGPVQLECQCQQTNSCIGDQLFRSLSLGTALCMKLARVWSNSVQKISSELTPSSSSRGQPLTTELWPMTVAIVRSFSIGPPVSL